MYSQGLYNDSKILKFPVFLTMPLGPNVLFTKSPIAMAPIKEDRRAVSALSSSAPALKILTGARERDA